MPPKDHDKYFYLYGIKERMNKLIEDSFTPILILETILPRPKSEAIVKNN